jgi:putative ATP-binding cassette transporter
MQGTRTVLAEMWALAKPWFVSEERMKARGLLAVVVALTLVMVGVNVVFSLWQARFYNALQEKDWDAFVRELTFFTVLAAIAIIVSGYNIYLKLVLQVRWRRWLTERILTAWLADRAYYRIQLTDQATDNPDQRIADDLRLFVSYTLSLGLGLLDAVVTLVSFIGILWGLSGPLSVMGIDIPGYMVWVALVYAGLGTWGAHIFGRRLVPLNFQKQRVEADFRYGLVRVRDNVEGIAFHKGEADEHARLDVRFAAVIDNWMLWARQTKILAWYTTFYGQAAVIFPFVVASPRYFFGPLPLGELVQTSTAFGQVQSSLAYFVTAYDTLAEWKATVDRLTTFRRAIEAARAAASDGVAVTEGAGEALTGEGLRVALPQGRVLLEDAALSVAPGEAVWLAGASGSGKTTLLRAIAGIWPFATGQVSVPAGKRVLFLPQRPYIPPGTLHAAVSYPDGAAAHTPEAVREALAAAGLERLAGDLTQDAEWDRKLSGGEQQRLAFARAFLLRPDFVVLDEATASLDPAAETALYEALRARLPRAGILSVAHRDSVGALHDRKVTLVREAEGAGRLVGA